MTILDNIDTILAELKMSRSALEKKAGIGRQSVEKWDKSIPRLDMILRVAEVLGVPLSRLLEGTELQTEKTATPEDDGSADDVILRFLRSLPKERLRGILLALEAPEEVLAALDREEPRG